MQINNANLQHLAANEVKQIIEVGNWRIVQITLLRFYEKTTGSPLRFWFRFFINNLFNHILTSAARWKISDAEPLN